MKLLPVSEFESLIETQVNIYENRKGVEIDFIDDICARIRIWDKSPTSFDLYVEMPAEDFMPAMNIKSWTDVDAIDQSTLCEQYKMGNGYVWADMDYLCTGGLIFRVSEGRTVLEGDMITYHDELDLVLDDISVLREYVRDHIRELYVAAEGSEKI